MSKTPFWQPGDKWQPPIVRIKGVDEKSPVGQRLLQAYEGTIKQFYLGAARAHALGSIDNSRSRKQFPDARMTYTNMAGQEIVEIELRPEVVETAESQVKNRMLPDWLLVEFVVEDGSNVSSNIAAFARSPDWRTLDLLVGGHLTTTSLGQGHWGGFGSSAYTQYDRLVSGISPVTGPVPPTTIQLDRGDPHRNTFVVDLRRLRNWPVMSFDFYGWITTDQFELVITHYNRDLPNLYDYTEESWGGVVVYDLLPLGGGPGEIISSSIPFMSVGSLFADAYSNYEREFLAAHTNILPPATKATPEYWDYWEPRRRDYFKGSRTWVSNWLWFNYKIPYTPNYILGVVTKPVVVNVKHKIFSGGSLNWRETRWQRVNDGPVTYPEAPNLPFYPYEQEFRTWELLNKVPTAQLAVADVLNVVSSDPPLTNTDVQQKYGYPYFGTYTLAQEEWSGSWGTPGAGP